MRGFWTVTLSLLALHSPPCHANWLKSLCSLIAGKSAAPPAAAVPAKPPPLTDHTYSLADAQKVASDLSGEFSPRVRDAVNKELALANFQREAGKHFRLATREDLLTEKNFLTVVPTEGGGAKLAIAEYRDGQMISTTSGGRYDGWLLGQNLWVLESADRPPQQQIFIPAREAIEIAEGITKRFNPEGGAPLPREEAYKAIPAEADKRFRRATEKDLRDREENPYFVTIVNGSGGGAIMRVAKVDNFGNLHSTQSNNVYTGKARDRLEQGNLWVLETPPKQYFTREKTEELVEKANQPGGNLDAFQPVKSYDELTRYQRKHEGVYPEVVAVLPTRGGGTKVFRAGLRRTLGGEMQLFDIEEPSLNFASGETVRKAIEAGHVRYAIEAGAIPLAGTLPAEPRFARTVRDYWEFSGGPKTQTGDVEPVMVKYRRPVTEEIRVVAENGPNGVKFYRQTGLGNRELDITTLGSWFAKSGGSIVGGLDFKVMVGRRDHGKPIEAVIVTTREESTDVRISRQPNRTLVGTNYLYTSEIILTSEALRQAAKEGRIYSDEPTPHKLNW